MGRAPGVEQKHLLARPLQARAVQAPNTPAPTTIVSAGRAAATAGAPAAATAAAAPALIAVRRVIPAIHPSGSAAAFGLGRAKSSHPAAAAADPCNASATVWRIFRAGAQPSP